MTARHTFATFLDVGETLVDETRAWGLWADALGVPRLTLFGVLGALAARGEPHGRVFELVAPGADLEVLDPGFSYVPGDLYPDALTCLRDLRAAGDLVGLVGNQPATTEAFLRELGVDVDVIGSSQAWGVEKPSPAFFRRVQDAAGLPTGRIAYVGDRVDNDVVPAAEAGMVAVFLRRGPWGLGQASWPEASRATVTLDSLAGLSDALAPFRPPLN